MFVPAFNPAVTLKNAFHSLYFSFFIPFTNPILLAGSF